jgi:hypothetical protein
MPGGRQRAGFGFAIAHHHCHQQIRVIKSGAKGVRDAVAEFTPLVNGTWSLRRAMAADAAGEGEFFEEGAHALLVFALIRIDLRIGALQIGRRDHARRTVARASQEDDIQVVLIDQAVEVNVGEAQAGTRAPVPQEAQLHVLLLQRLTEQRVGPQIDHAGSQVVAGAPVGVYVVQLCGGQPGGGRGVAAIGRRRLHVGTRACHRCSPS